MHMMEEMAWVDIDTVTGGTIARMKCPSSIGQRLIILYAGSVDG